MYCTSSPIRNGRILGLIYRCKVKSEYKFYGITPFTFYYLKEPSQGAIHPVLFKEMSARREFDRGANAL